MDNEKFSYLLSMDGPISSIVDAYRSLAKLYQVNERDSFSDVFDSNCLYIYTHQGIATLTSFADTSVAEISGLPSYISEMLEAIDAPELIVELKVRNLNNLQDTHTHHWKSGEHRERRAIIIYPTFSENVSAHKIFDALETESGNLDYTNKVELLAQLLSQDIPSPALGSEKDSTHIEDSRKQAASAPQYASHSLDRQNGRLILGMANVSIEDIVVMSFDEIYGAADTYE